MPLRSSVGLLTMALYVPQESGPKRFAATMDSRFGKMASEHAEASVLKLAKLASDDSGIVT